MCVILICSLTLVSGTAALEEDAQILKVIEAYCTSAKTRQTLNSSKSMHTCTDTHSHTDRPLAVSLTMISSLL